MDRKRLSLPNNCQCTKPKLSKQKSGKWKIWYRFYEPGILPKFVEIKAGINAIEDLHERQADAKELIDSELYRLKIRGFNPNTGTYNVPDDDYQIHPTTPFIQALRKALEGKSCVSHTKEDIISVLNYTEKAAVALRYDHVSVCNIKRRHIKAVLMKLESIKGKWTNNAFNHYRKYLRILFEDLIEYETIEYNPVDKIKTKRVLRKQRRILTDDECQKIFDFVADYDPRFLILLNCFYSSGSRTTEIFKVQGKHVDIPRRKVTYEVLKGSSPAMIDRPITDEALPYWELAMQGCGKEDYVFSKGLKPDKIKISSRQATIRWKRHIKSDKEGKLGIDCDWYSLKYLFTTRTVDQAMAMLKRAQESATVYTGHKSTKMIAKVYDINSKSRFNDEIRENSTGFAQSS